MLHDALQEAAARWPDRIAIRDGDGSRSWREVAAEVATAASGLDALAVAPGERVALLASNEPAFLTATFAAARIGAVLVPLNPRLAIPEQLQVLEAAAPRLLLHAEGTDRSAHRLGELADLPCASLPSLLGGDGPAPRPTIDPSASAHLYFTSGTTGRPKGVVLTHDNVLTHARNAVHELGLTAEDRWAHVAPMFHLADAWATVAVTLVGGSHVFLPRFDAARALDLLQHAGVTCTNLVPTMLNDMVRHESAAGRTFPSLRLLLSGGAPIAPRVVEEIEALFACTYAQTYGLTETSPYLTISLLDERHAGLSEDERRAARARTGRPFHGVEVEVVDERGEPVPDDDRTVGEVRARGRTVTPGYWNDLEATRAAFRDGWFHTGDLAVVDALGSLRIVDRKKDMILTGAECVYSTEVEDVLYEHPDVYEAAVFGLPHPRWGEAVQAALVPRAGHSVDVDSVQAFCRERLAGYKCPKALHVLAELPRTGSGKISKRLLRERLAGAPNAGSGATDDRAAPK